MLRLSLIALGLLFASTAAAQPFNAHVFLNRASDRDVVVEEVTSFGFYLDGGRGMLYRQIDSLHTREVGLVERIRDELPTARVAERAGDFSVYIDRATVSRHQPRTSNKIVEEIGVVGGVVGGERLGVTTAVQVSPRGTGPFFAAVHSSLGWGLTTGTYKAGVGLGLGARFTSGGRGTIVAELTVWQQFLQDENERADVSSGALNSNPNALALGIGLDYPVSRRFQLAAGARYFAFDLETSGDELPVVGFLGVRYQVLGR